ncbi:hypothetical protein BN6_84520 [Saccharothrix espanaensis DSM 44229]|uniref:Uncharacterized protein n=1 Tax=Saccharothrix espanaensis (strain ATCC 51144 / DSM 44229 / JCM 9112 / NBRC 15066 / NRRL 15764) TaxID=1179773 RepID=K0KDN4_SACES|nr:hypothetical protein BN6_84520 [Saccharothrix espanaensis DSM 44229]
MPWERRAWDTRRLLREGVQGKVTSAENGEQDDANASIRNVGAPLSERGSARCELHQLPLIPALCR